MKICIFVFHSIVIFSSLKYLYLYMVISVIKIISILRFLLLSFIYSFIVRIFKTVPGASKMIGATISFMFHNVFSFLTCSKYQWQGCITYTYTHEKNPNKIVGCPRGVMVKAMDCGIVVREFVLQSCYYIHFQANTLGKGMNPTYPPNYGLNSSTTVLLRELFWH